MLAGCLNSDTPPVIVAGDNSVLSCLSDPVAFLAPEIFAFQNLPSCLVGV